MEKHFVKFLSPGTFVSEETTKEIEQWDVEKAVAMSKSVSERYGALPYGFYFITRERKDDELDSKITKTSGMYYLGGDILTIDDVEARNDPNDRTLISNMRVNGWNRIVENKNSYRWTQPLNDGDIVLDI